MASSQAIKQAAAELHPDPDMRIAAASAATVDKHRDCLKTHSESQASERRPVSPQCFPGRGWGCPVRLHTQLNIGSRLIMADTQC